MVLESMGKDLPGTVQEEHVDYVRVVLQGMIGQPVQFEDVASEDGLCAACCHIPGDGDGPAVGGMTDDSTLSGVKPGSGDIQVKQE
ncbi:MAG: hypothetical protein AB1445_08670 [Bacillota bacterium]